MGIHFNGMVTINGNVEMFDNGSMKITNNNTINININDLEDFIEENLKYSLNKNEYIEASKIIKNSIQKNEIKNSIEKLKEMAKEFGKTILFNGLSNIAIETIKETL